MSRRLRGPSVRFDGGNPSADNPTENPGPARLTGRKASGGRRKDASGRWIRAQDCVPLPWRLLLVIVNENDPDKLVIKLSAKPSWLLLLESDFQLDDLRAIYIALKKCCAAQSSNLLRTFLSETFVGKPKFLTQCCVLFSNLTEEGDSKLVEDVLSVLEASACIQPAGLAAPCMVLLRSLEGHPMIGTWNDQSDNDFVDKIQSISEQLTAAAKTGAMPGRSGSSSAPMLYKGYRTSGKAPNDFREMSIFPTKADLEEKNPFLRLNRVKGAYENLDDYLDVQFRLLREDFVSPLRNGLREFRNLGAEVSRWKLRSIQNVRFYLGVVFQKSKDTQAVHGVRDCITVILPEKDCKRVRWDVSRRFTNGSLVGISPDNFETIIFATVRNRDPEKLKTSGTLTLELCSEEETSKFEAEVGLSLIECSGAYFEAYRHNLAALQKMTEMPLSQYIVQAERRVSRPSFISSEGKYTLETILRGTEDKTTAFTFDLWPPVEDTILNARQLEAVRSAFRNELCIIQGPPGTGKTFVGLKIVELMLLNRLTTRPLLIVCYTNHALDQFLEGISAFTQSIVRIGGRCASGELEKFTLRTFRYDTREKLVNVVPFERDLRLKIRWAHGERLRYETAKIEIEKKLARFEGRAIYGKAGLSGITWSEVLDFHSIEMDPAHSTQENDEEDFEDEAQLSDEDRGQLEEDIGRIATSCNSKREKALRDWLGSDQQYQFMRKIPRFVSTLTYAQYKLSKLSLTASNELHGLQRLPTSQLDQMDWWTLYRDEHWDRVSDEAALYIQCCMNSKLRTNQRIFVSREELLNLKDREMGDVELSIKCLKFRLEEVNTRLRRIMRNLWELENALDFEIINNVQIIGITTTGAAKYSELLRKVKYEIVVVEEAAEVLEAHLVTCVSPSTKQLVLIGDHQQLQPNATVHNLATNFNMQVSLFERLITNGMPYVRLQEQHRMRDEFLKVLVPTIYSDYFSHESVSGYEDIRGLSHNMFFVTHAFNENTEKETNSRTNSFEAEFVARLALYLRMQSYTPKQIAILTTYSGQVFAIRNVIHSLDKQYGWTGMKTVVDRDGTRSRVPTRPELPLSLFDGIRITTVDNYQGEESDIVIASFVRSNEEQKIGFLSRDNRVCVALSRAKRGFYCVGNLAMLAQASQTWRDISEVLLKGNYVNKGIELKCEVHDMRLLATKGSDFDLFSDGGCQEPCGIRLNCGHPCPKTCHKFDASHKEFQCLEKCEKIQPCGHPCTKSCFNRCGRCTFNVIRTLACGHSVEVECPTPVEKIRCQEPCERLMPCGVHPCERECYQNCGKCMEIVEVEASCGHQIRIVCRDSEDKEILRDACDVKVELLCGHINVVECRDRTAGVLNMDMCEQLTEVTCSLGHSFLLKCPIAMSGKIDEHCSQITQVKMACGHEVLQPCNRIAELDLESLRAECEQPVAVTPVCGHEIQVPCRKKKDDEFCGVPCQAAELECGHTVNRKCSEVKSCTAEVTLQSPCGHEVVAKYSMRGQEIDLLELCSESCTKILACGHLCSGTCSSCKGPFHQPCRNKCGKTSFCGHRCTSRCHSQCDPCLVMESASCPHSTKPRSCLSEIHDTCTEKPQHCPHLKISCGAKTCAGCHCYCDKPCQKKLPCGGVKRGKYGNERGNHSCVGLCSELCICQVCRSKNINQVILPSGLSRKDARFIRLPCNHVFEVTWLDAYMHEHKDLLSFPKCPAKGCTSQIRLLRRYHGLLERIRLNMLELYTKVFGERNEMIVAYEQFFKKSQKIRAPGYTVFEEKAFHLRDTPSLFKLDYMTTLSKIFPGNTVESFTHIETIINTDECQLQLLSDCLLLMNKLRIGSGEAPIEIPEEPMPVDQWALCEHNHVFLETVNSNECPECFRHAEGPCDSSVDNKLASDDISVELPEKPMAEWAVCICGHVSPNSVLLQFEKCPKCPRIEIFAEAGGPLESLLITESGMISTIKYGEDSLILES